MLELGRQTHWSRREDERRSVFLVRVAAGNIEQRIKRDADPKLTKCPKAGAAER